MEYRHTLTAVIIGLCAVGVAFSVTVIKPEKYEVLEHRNLLVVCNATSGPDTIIYWTKNDTKSTFFQNGTKLELIDVTRDEKGQYVCHALNTSAEQDNTTEWNRTVQVIDVDVQYPAKFLQCEVGPTTIMANQTYAVFYNIEGNPGPSWQIMNNKTGWAIVSATGIAASGSLGSIEVRCGESGYILCTGFNHLNHGKNTTGGAYLNILCGPAPSIYIYPSYSKESSLHETANFTMYFVGNPTPTLTWTRDDGQLIPWSRVQQVDTDSTSTLIFTDVQVEDFTNYTLTMSNVYNTTKSQFKLLPKGQPLPPTVLSYYDVTYDSVTLSWTAGYPMGEWQRFQVYGMEGDRTSTMSEAIYDYDTRPVAIGRRFTYTLKNLLPARFYNLSVQAENSQGHLSEFAKPFATFTTITDPNPPYYSSGSDVGVIIGCSLGGFGVIAFLAFLVYILRYRKLRTGYTKT